MYTTRNKQSRVVIVGGGFAGLAAAKALADAPVEVLLLDRHNYHTFLPLLYQVAAAEVDPSQIGYPIRTILRSIKNADFMMADVNSVDLDGECLVTQQGNIPYDYLIMATGSEARFFNIPGAQEHTYTMKSMSDGIDLRNHLLAQFEAASLEVDRERIRQLLTFAVIGGGPSGVEYAGALKELIDGPLAKDYPNLCINEARVILIEALPTLLGTMPEKLGNYAVERLEEMGVEVVLQQRVSRVTADAVYLADGATIATQTAVWTAGVGGEGIADRSGMEMQADNTVPVLSTLQVAGEPNIYVAGDLAAFEHDGERLPMVAQVAMQQGTLAAQNIVRQIKGERLVSFKYKDRGSMAVIGRNAAVAHIAGKAFTGFSAWLIWLLVHIAQLIGYRNRLLVLVNWAWSYFTFERMVRLILPDALENVDGTVQSYDMVSEDQMSESRLQFAEKDRQQ
jgi:NADH dehydrogenase